MYCVINKETKLIECVYDEFGAAEIMARNLNNSYANKEFIITNGRTEDRPTSKQMYRIKQIENECNIEFTGTTKTDAKRFLDKYLNQLNG